MKKRHLQWSLVGMLLCSTLTSCDQIKRLLPKPPDVTTKVVQASSEESTDPPALSDPSVYAPEDAIPVAKVVEFELNKSSLVSIICYHDYHETTSRNDMTISAAAFRSQLQALKDSNIPVIPLSDVIEWKKGKKNIPDEAVVITMDDGWQGVYQVAFPILKEFGYPFTLYLYKNYLNSGGRTLNLDQVREMMANGAELGSHSVSHHALASKKGRSEEQHRAWVKMELEESKRFLEATFGVSMRSFAYPYGSKSDEIAKMTLEAGYDIAVTVNPQKVTWDTDNSVLPRFVALGDTLTNFKIATSFRGMGSSIADSKVLKNDATNEQGEKLIELNPPAESKVNDRTPLITVNVSKLGEILPETIQMRVSGFGPVPAEYNSETKSITYQVQQKLRLETCNVTLKFKRVDAEKEDVISWEFKVDQDHSYLPLVQFSKPNTEVKADTSAPAPQAN